VHLEITLAADATERDEEGLRRIAKTCPVSRSLHPDIDQDVQLVFRRA
jgi:organic hydroperoxide reductase OsmC/OhrA